MKTEMEKRLPLAKTSEKGVDMGIITQAPDLIKWVESVVPSLLVGERPVAALGKKAGTAETVLGCMGGGMPPVEGVIKIFLSQKCLFKPM